MSLALETPPPPSSDVKTARKPAVHGRYTRSLTILSIRRTTRLRTFNKGKATLDAICTTPTNKPGVHRASAHKPVPEAQNARSAARETMRGRREEPVGLERSLLAE